jgi:hypothetical protein
MRLKGGAPVSTESKKEEMHTEAHALVKTWKTTTAEYQPALAA